MPLSSSRYDLDPPSLIYRKKEAKASEFSQKKKERENS